MPVHYLAVIKALQWLHPLTCFPSSVHTPLWLETKIFYRGEYKKNGLATGTLFSFSGRLKYEKAIHVLTRLNVAPDVVSKVDATSRKGRQPRADP